MPKNKDILAIFKDRDFFSEFSYLMKEEGFELDFHSNIENKNFKFSSYKLALIDDKSLNDLIKFFNFTDSLPINFFLFSKGEKNKKKNLTIIKTPIVFNNFIKELSNKLNDNNLFEGTAKFGEFFFFPNKMGLFNKSSKRIVKFTELENKLLNFLLGKKSGSTKNEILSNVWGHNIELETHTLESLIYRLRKKIENNPNKPKILIQVKKKYFINI